VEGIEYVVSRNSPHPPKKSLTTSRSVQPGGSPRLSSQTAPLLVEIGTEELPSSIISLVLGQLADAAASFFKEHRLLHGSLRTLGTPRRLVVLVEGLASHQASLSQEIMGPPKAAALDEQGRITQAAKGFARSQGVPIENLEVRETPKGAYMCAVKHQKGRAASVLLREQLPCLLQYLSFPKAMRWNASRVRFARPVRWIAALHGHRPLSFSFADVRAGTITYGHRFLHTAQPGHATTIELTDPALYVAAVRRKGVMVDPAERRAVIQTQLSSLARSVKGRLYPDYFKELLNEAVYSVEWPQCIMGRFHKKYLHLPQEVLITAMREHQGYFSVMGRDGALLPRFMTVTNMKLSNMDLIRKGHERVLAARLNDAQYFYQEDRKHSLGERVDQLNGVIFHQKLGTLFQKMERIRTIIKTVAELVGRKELCSVSERAAYLAKGDLTTGMVGEFPSLQGVMGREYARCDGETEEVATALWEQYLPRTPDDMLPRSSVGSFLSLADRCDMLAAFFRVGLIPSGSEDPFALRRSAFGLVRIVIEGKCSINLVTVLKQLDHLLSLQGVMEIQGDRDSDGAHHNHWQALLDFLGERLRYYGRTTSGLREDVMEAVWMARPSDTCDLYDLLVRMQALQRVTAQPEFDPLMIGFKRAHRLVKKEGWTKETVRPELFEHKAERMLFDAVQSSQGQVATCLERQDYASAIKTLLAFKSPIDEFFAGVMVNADNQMVRANRLALLYRIDRLFGRIADFSRIQS